MNVVGIGSAGCNISQYLEKYSFYKTYQIDVKNNRYSNFFKVKKQKDHEAYEREYSPLQLDLNSEETILILSGAGDISGIVLRVLQEIDRNDIRVLYIKPRNSEMSKVQKTRHKIVNQILQQYCRSNKLGEMTIIDNSKVEDLISEISLNDYWPPINQMIGDTLHMINFFKSSEALIKSNNEIPKTAVISTFSLVDFKNLDEKSLYDLAFPRAKSYYFVLGSQFIKDNKGILTDVREFVSSRQTEKCDCSYEIHQTEYEQNYVYGYHYASFIQDEEEKLFTD